MLITTKRAGRWIEVAMTSAKGTRMVGVAPSSASVNEIGQLKQDMRTAIKRREAGIPAIMDLMRRKNGKGKKGHVCMVDEGRRLVWLSNRAKPLRWAAVEWCE